jgi:flagellar hook assembly protein FlgD
MLFDNYPNPFNPSTTIRYALPGQANVTLRIYNILGQEIRTLVNERQSAGVRSVVWDGRNNLNQAVSSGIYIYRLQAGARVLSKKMILLE